MVDAQLRVHGIPGLRIADASIMPSLTSGNTCSPVLVIAEKAAQMILAERRREAAPQVVESAGGRRQGGGGGLRIATPRIAWRPAPQRSTLKTEMADNNKSPHAGEPQ